MLKGQSSLGCRPGSPESAYLTSLSSSDGQVKGAPAEPSESRMILEASEKGPPGERVRWRGAFPNPSSVTGSQCFQFTVYNRIRI